VEGGIPSGRNRCCKESYAGSVILVEAVLKPPWSRCVERDAMQGRVTKRHMSSTTHDAEQDSNSDGGTHAGFRTASSLPLADQCLGEPLGACVCHHDRIAAESARFSAGDSGKTVLTPPGW
jgi:hypothetical protein